MVHPNSAGMFLGHVRAMIIEFELFRTEPEQVFLLLAEVMSEIFASNASLLAI